MIQPVLRPLPEKKRYMLCKKYEVTYGDLTISIPPGFVYDGASVPKGAWYSTYSPFQPVCMASAICHDFLYSSKIVPRKMADKIFYDFLILNGANKLKAKLMYRAVRWFGGNHY